MRNRFIIIVLSLLSTLVPIQAQENANERQAKRIFNQAYQQVFGEQGATLRYDVNITGLYKTWGTIWYKGKKHVHANRLPYSETVPSMPSSICQMVFC